MENTFTCPHAKECGGCLYQGISYEEQLKKKQNIVEKLLKGFGKVNPIIGMEDPYHYRNKVHHVFGSGRKGEVFSGTYKAGTHKLVPITSCLIEDELSQRIIQTIEKFLVSFKLMPYDEDKKTGLVRHVLIRRGFTSGEVMVVMVLAKPIFPSSNNFAKALVKAHPEITTVAMNVNDKKTSMVLGEREKILYGKGFIRDTLCGCTFRISPKSFYQINSVQTEVLYGTAVEYAGLTGKESVIDAYCGIGTIGLVAAPHAKSVIGVELNGDAVKDAILNAKENKFKNARFYKGDAGKFMEAMAYDKQRADVVFMDPPRSGSDKKFMDSLAKMGPKKVVYVSCNPETLARDLKHMTKLGYSVEKIQPVDMFPFTEHCEVIALLQRVN